MKNFKHQSYRGNFVIPKADTFFDEKLNLLNVGFSWGEINPFKEVNEQISNYFANSRNDFESTSPFELIPSLTPLLNVLRTSILIANEKIYRIQNKKNYVSGLALLTIGISGQELAIAQIGDFTTFLLKKNQKQILLTSGFSIFSSFSENTPPLPHQLLGTENLCYPQLVSFNFEPGDTLFLLNSPRVAKGIFELDSKLSLNENIIKFSSSDIDMPFWMGSLEL